MRQCLKMYNLSQEYYVKYLPSGQELTQNDLRNYTERRTQIANRCVTYSMCIVYAFLLLFISPINAYYQRCSFEESGTDVQGVKPVYLSCSGGTVTWNYPKGGLRVVLTYPHYEGEFRACIKFHRPPERTRIFLEGHRTLLPLDKTPMLVTHCFSSYKGRVGLYLETIPGNRSVTSEKKAGVSFEYDLKPFSGNIYDSSEECRPCSNKELLHHFCTANFVAKGHFLTQKEDDVTQMTTMTFLAGKVYRQLADNFQVSKNSIFHKQHMYEGQIHIPIHCKAHSGPGEFLIMGYMRLGDPILKCAAKFSDWKRLSSKYSQKTICEDI